MSDGYAERLLETTLVKEKYPNIAEPELEKMLISFEVFFTSLQTTVISQNPSTSLLDLISSLGGTLGIFLGASLLSLCEIIEFFIAASRIMAQRRKGNQIDSNTHVI